MAAQRATAAEKTAPAGSMVMLGDVLRLGRGGSGCSVSGGPGGPGGPGAVDLMGGAPVLTLRCVPEACALRAFSRFWEWDFSFQAWSRTWGGARRRLPLKSVDVPFCETRYGARAVPSAPHTTFPLFRAHLRSRTPRRRPAQRFCL